MNTPRRLKAEPRRLIGVAVVVLPILLATNLGASGPGVVCGAAGNAGFLDVTTGGAQDIAAGRRVIEEGGYPDPEAITVEGFLAEHSIPFPRPEDPGLLFATANLAIDEPFDGYMPLATLQIGFGTSIPTGSVERSPLNLCLVIDRSGSMADSNDGTTGATKWWALEIAVDRLLGQLDGDDLVSVVTFNHQVATKAEAVAGDDMASVKQAIEGVELVGNTNLYAGMKRGYELVEKHSDESRDDRIIVFTDANPTTGSLVAADMLGGMKVHANRGVGTTIFGIGADFGYELARDISRVRGGNYAFLSDYDRIVTVFDEEFDYLMTPIAYDVALTASVSYAFDVHDVYGVPGADPTSHEFTLDIPTLFVSNRGGGGAAFVRLRPGSLVDYEKVNRVAELTVAYTLPTGTDVEDTLVVDLPPLELDEDGAYYQDENARRGCLLLETALTLQAAAEDMTQPNDCYGYWYSYCDPRGDRHTASDRLVRFLNYFDAMAEGLVDRIDDSSRALSEERALLEQFLGNIW